MSDPKGTNVPKYNTSAEVSIRMQRAGLFELVSVARGRLARLRAVKTRGQTALNGADEEAS